MNNTKRKLPVIVIVLLSVLAVLVIAFAAVFFLVYSKLEMMKRPGETQKTGTTFEELMNSTPEEGDYTGDGDEEGDAPIQVETTQEDIDNADSGLDDLQEMEDLQLEQDVVNYLLIGNDTRSEGEYGNSDTMIVVSVNQKTGKIHLTSLMRAMYVNISGHYHGMLNWAYSIGGPELLEETIEENFKIHIDHYFAVDFSSFEAVIDTLGGVDVELTAAEARRINYKSSTGTPCEEGMNHLNGEQALYHARNRSTDNDFKRTGRQRAIVEAILEEMKGAGVSQLNTITNEVLPYVETDMTSMEIISLLPTAVKWLDYDIDQLMLPVENMAGETYIGITMVNGHEMYTVDWNNNLSVLEEFINS